MKNDLIILSIFLIILICSFYFNVKEGYVTPMPISFVGEGDNQTIITPNNIGSENGKLKITSPTLIGNTTINGNKNVNNLSYLRDANVTGATTLNVANVTGATTLNSANVNGATNLNVANINGNFNVNGLLRTRNIVMGNTIRIVGIQTGNSSISGHNFFVKFPVDFPDGQIIVVTSPSGSTTGWEWNFMTNVLGTDKTGFYVTITGISGGGTWEPNNVSIQWIACCIVLTPEQQAEQNEINRQARIIGDQIQARIEEEERRRREEEERKRREWEEELRRAAEDAWNSVSDFFGW
jgi:hypothetical protein